MTQKSNIAILLEMKEAGKLNEWECEFAEEMKRFGNRRMKMLSEKQKNKLRVIISRA